jgi:hypothetical protein
MEINFRNWRKNGTWLHIHDSLRDWMRIELQRHASPYSLFISNADLDAVNFLSFDKIFLPEV